jgi:hypothetical protein
VPQGLTLMVAFYVFREAWNILHEGNRKYGDAFMDAAVPMLAVLLWIQAVR